MQPNVTTLLETPPGFMSPEVARFVWQLDEQSRRLITDLRGISPEELAWQPLPGMNTIGMLLAHIADVEVSWMKRIVVDNADADIEVEDVLGIRSEHMGVPLPENGAPPESLAGRDMRFFADLLARARAHTRRAAQPLTDMDLDRILTRHRPDGSKRVINIGWVLYHLVEHEAGHHYQINLLRHWDRAWGE